MLFKHRLPVLPLLFSLMLLLVAGVLVMIRPDPAPRPSPQQREVLLVDPAPAPEAPAVILEPALPPVETPVESSLLQTSTTEIAPPQESSEEIAAPEAFDLSQEPMRIMHNAEAKEFVRQTQVSNMPPKPQAPKATPLPPSPEPEPVISREASRQQVAAAPAAQQPFFERLAAAARSRTLHKITYDPAYVVIPYPGGDVPPNTGVCTDVVVRSYRILGIDLQKEVHEDMRSNFSKYPTRWGRTEPDPNIDHRRVQNLMTFFERHGEKLAVTQNPRDYHPGDIVTWQLSVGMHIGIVADQKAQHRERYKVVHNVGLGPKMEDFLFAYPITGHYRYSGPKTETAAAKEGGDLVSAR